MLPNDFAYWLQGFAEVNGAAPTDEQWQIIKDHLALVFTKITPERKPLVDAFHHNMTMQEVLSKCQLGNGKPLVATC